MKPDKRDPMVRAIEAISGMMIVGMEDHAAARSLQGEVNRMRLGAEALDNVNANRSPLDTPAAHAMKVAKMARKFNSEVTDSINRAGQTWRDGYGGIQRRIGEKVDLKPHPLADEIRTVFRGLDAKGKAALVNKLVDENRGPELAAIVTAPSILTNITDEQKAAYEKGIIAKHAAAELEEEQKLEEVFQAVFHAQGAASSFVRSLTDPAKLAEIERGEAAAIAAGAAFDQSMQ